MPNFPHPKYMRLECGSAMKVEDGLFLFFAFFSAKKRQEQWI